ncbi:MAG: hypothetical protein WDO68_15405 [Gammaproteobacteria bacterium]
MTAQDPNLERVELVATALGPLREQLVFVGGCAAGLLMNEPGATPTHTESRLMKCWSAFKSSRNFPRE